MPKLIREIRWGKSKQFKTGAVVGTYPKPLLLLSFDEEGYTVLPSKGAKLNPDYIPLDSTVEDIVRIKPNEVLNYQNKLRNELPRITLIDFCDSSMKNLLATYVPNPNPTPMSDYMSVVNSLVNGKCPWATVVDDPITGLTDIILAHIGSINLQLMNDPRRWASMAGEKIRQNIAVLTQLPCHVVFIMHSALDKDEKSGELIELPLVYSSIRQQIGALVSQFFYATKENKKPVIWTTDQGYVKGIGARWPADLPAVCAPDFKSIYGRELL